MKQLLLFFALALLTVGIAAADHLRQQPKKIKIELTVSEAETVIQALGKISYEQAAPIINSIITQAQKQLQDTTKPKK